MLEIRLNAQDLSLPEGFDPAKDTVFYTASPLVRCVETIRNVNIGMNNAQLLKGGVPVAKINGVHAMAPAVKATAAPYRLTFVGDKAGHPALGEPAFFAYVDGKLVEDHEGNQLFVESSTPENKGRFPSGSFRYQATVAMDQGDDRIQETPEQVAQRGLAYLVPKLSEGRQRVVQGATHTFGIEALFNAVRGVPMGNDGNDLYANAEGSFDQGGFFEVRVQYDADKTKFADRMQIARTMDFDRRQETDGYNGMKLLSPQEIPSGTLLRFLR